MVRPPTPRWIRAATARLTPDPQSAPTIIIGGSGSGSGSSADFETPEGRSLFDELRAFLAPRFTIARPLAAGGMGSIYLGFDPLLKRSVAVKLLRPDLASDDQARSRFLREAELAAAVAHPNVVAIYDVGMLPASGAPYFVMQFVDGVELGTLLGERPSNSELQARRIVGEVAAALAAAHARGLVHRDIKPQNVLLERETGRAIVVDFGIGVVMERRTAESAPATTGDGDVYLGTPMYTSPEHARGLPLTGKSDVYSLGVLAFELLTGEPPFTGATVKEVLSAHVHTPPTPMRVRRPDIAPQFAAIIDRCLAKSPDDRPSAAEVTRALLPDGAAQQALEWPPPGLDALHRRGRAILRSLSGAAIAAVTFMSTLAIQPDAASARWDLPETSALWSHLATGTITLARNQGADSDSPVIWFFLLFLAAATVLTTLGALLITALRGGLALRDAMRAGYSWSVARDTLFDWWADTRALHNGTGLFALLAPARRRQLARWRRTATARVCATLVIAVLTPWFWLVGVERIRGASFTKALSDWELLLALLPLIIGGILVVSARWREWTQRVRSRRTLTLTPRALWQSTVTARPEVIASWLRAAGERPSPVRRPLEIVSTLVPGAVLGISAVVATTAAAACVALVLLLGSITHELHDARRNAYAWLDSYRHDSLTFARIDTAMATAATHPDVGDRARARADLAVARRLLRSPSLDDLRKGEVLAVASAGRLRATGRATNDDRAVIDALRVRSVITHLGEAHPTPADLRDLMSDPALPRGMSLAADKRLMPAVRASLALYGVPLGFCADAREILFGVDARRSASLRSAAAAVADIGGTAQIAQTAERWLAHPTEGGIAGVQPRGEVAPAWLRVLPWFGLSGLAERVSICRAAAGDAAGAE